MAVSKLEPDSFLHGLPGPRPFVIGLFCAFILSKAGRKMAAHVIMGNLRKLLLHLPLRIRCRIVSRIFSFPIHTGRRLMQNTTVPYGYQWDSIAKVKHGHWIIPNVQGQGGAAWAEKTANDADLILFYIHGGGFTIGDSLMYMTSYTYMIERFAQVHNIKARVFAVEYGLVPEVHWPKPREDVEEAYSYLIRDLKVNPAKVIFGGDSAGGNLTATTLLSIRDQLRSGSVIALSSMARLPLPMPRGGILISPWCNLEASSPTYITNAATDCLPIRHGHRNNTYIANFDKLSKEEQDTLISNPDVSPLFASYEGVCPLMVTVGGLEVFQHEIETLIQKLQRDGVHVDVLSRPDCPHVWVVEPFLSPNVKVWAQGISQLTDWCAERLHQ
ncbi:Alpha/Beta hydrolase protein [Zychaea mexicana]|uniref:Alpha/Beta hydrolase protein n=1 Tax=Zychaea mexicana TaxID=64656 RepID=UPI0022FDEE71|nr:Alpha/Beta hydrolase protein [Zychaea mexicana]KAI9497713.1 Alpha/Beta hydrolase protein [Zychaea mexicana]